MEPKIDAWARIFRGLIGIVLFMSLPVAVMADSVTLTWQGNTEADLAGYKIYIGSSPGVYTQTIDVGRVTTFTVSGLSPGGIYFFSITAYDIFANESGYSAELRATIPGPSTPPPQPAPLPASPREAAMQTPPSTTHADDVAPQGVGGDSGTSASSRGSSSSPSLLATLIDSVRNVFSGGSGARKSPSAALVPQSGSPSARTASPTNPTNPINPTNSINPRSAGEREIEVERLHQQGREQYAQGKIEEAISQLRQAAVISAGLPVSEQAAVAAHDLGVVYYAAERHTEAVRSYKKALAVYRQLENRELEARVLDHLGRAYEALGDYTRADEAYKASLEIWKGLGKRAEVAAVLARLGGAQAAAGRYASALTSYQRSVALYQGLEDLDKLEKLRAAITQVERMASQSGLPPGR